MGTVLKRDIKGSTANANAYASNTLAGLTAGELLFAFSHATGSVDTAPTCVGSANGVLFLPLTGSPLIHTLSGNVSGLWVADRLVPASPAAMTVTINHPTDPATGCFIAVGAVTGMTKVGLAAILKSAFAANLAAGAAWDAPFGSATNTANPLAGFVGHAGGAQATPPGVSPPSGWTEIDEPVDQATPASGFEWASVDSGQTAATYTWTSSVSRTRANVAAIEFDTSVNGGYPYELLTPTPRYY